VATPGRNEPCPCGSGRRYKLCHGRIVPQARRVDFVVAGTQKGGTSALDVYLRDHPQVCMPATVKEVHYFDDEPHFARGADYTIYHGFFEPRATDRVVGEATPYYMYWAPVAARIHAYNPAMKFIILLRNPATRAYSHWNMEVKKKRETLPFEEALAREDERLAATPTRQHKRISYVDRGRYSVQLARLRALFPAEQILVMRSDALKRDPAAALAEVARFLDIPPFPPLAPRVVNNLPYEKPMSVAASAWLQRAFEGEIDALESMLGWDLSDWRRPVATGS
jgi:hypothetical protein